MNGIYLNDTALCDFPPLVASTGLPQEIFDLTVHTAHLLLSPGLDVLKKLLVYSNQERFTGSQTILNAYAKVSYRQ